METESAQNAEEPGPEPCYGGYSYTHGQQSEEDDGNDEDGALEKQQSIATHMDNLANYSAGALQLDHECIGPNIGKEL